MLRHDGQRQQQFILDQLARVECTAEVGRAAALRTDHQQVPVVAGDSLSKIAKREYGDASQWKKIHEANKDTIKNPDLIHPGQTLRLP